MIFFILVNTANYKIMLEFLTHNIPRLIKIYLNFTNKNNKNTIKARIVKILNFANQTAIKARAARIKRIEM